MCIICVSKKGVKQPDETLLQKMFQANPHGAGYMYCKNNYVIIHKGFMTFYDLLKAVKAENFTEDDPVIYHFRISTQAGITPFMTHPFPLTSHIEYCRKLDLKCKCGVVHNGIIQMTSDSRDKTYNDTARFISKYLVKFIRNSKDFTDGASFDILEELSRSKWAFLTDEGNVYTVGNFIEDDGLLFSNLTYKDFYPRFIY